MALSEMDLKDAVAVAERIRAAIAAIEIPTRGGETIAVTASVGVSALNLEAPARQDLIAAADDALYRAKRAGKNRVVGHESSTGRGGALTLAGDGSLRVSRRGHRPARQTPPAPPGSDRARPALIHPRRLCGQAGLDASRSPSAARSSSLGLHRPAATLARTCSGFVAPAITEATAGRASSPPIATSRIVTPRSSA